MVLPCCVELSTEGVAPAAFNTGNTIAIKSDIFIIKPAELILVILSLSDFLRYYVRVTVISRQVGVRNIIIDKCFGM